MINLLFVCFCVFAFFSWRDIRRVKKHDGVLFPFCQLRRDIMRFLYENVFENPGALSHEEYQSVRRLLGVLNGAISNYNKHKTVMFDLREMAKHLETYRHTSMPTVEVPDNPEIRELHRRFGRLLVRAFIAYTPLIRWELAVWLIAQAYRAGKEAGARAVAAEYVISNASEVRNDARRYGLNVVGVPI